MSRSKRLYKWVKFLLFAAPVVALLVLVLFWSGAKTSEKGVGYAAIEYTQVDGTFWGPVGSITVQKRFARHQHVEFKIITPPCSAIHNVSTIDGGKKTPWGLLSRFVKDKYNRPGRRVDPGVLEYLSQGVYNLALHPGLSDGTPRCYSLSCDALYEINEEGWLEIDIPMERIYSREVNLNKVSFNLVINEPRGIVEWDLPEGVVVANSGGGGYKIEGEWSSTRETEYLKVRWRIHENSLSNLERGRINGKGLKLGTSDTLYQIAGIPFGRHKTSLSFLTKQIPSDGLFGHVVSCDWTGDKRTLIPMYGDSVSSDSSIAVDVPVEVMKRLKAAIRVSARYHETKILLRKRSRANYKSSEYVSLTNQIQHSLPEMIGISQKAQIVSPVASFYVKPELTKNRCYDFSLTDRNIYFEGKREQRRAGGRIDFEYDDWDTSRTIRSWFGEKWAEYSDCGQCLAFRKRIIGVMEMYSMDYGTIISEDLVRSHEGGDIQGEVLFKPSSGFRGEAAFWYDHLTGLREFVKLGIFLDQRIEEGYLEKEVKDSRPYKHAVDRYVFLGNYEIFCLDHGFMNFSHRWPKGASAKQQLRTYGLTDQQRLGQASDEPL